MFLHSIMVQILFHIMLILSFINKSFNITQAELDKLRTYIETELMQYNTGAEELTKGSIIENECGLINQEGVCYFNSVIQALFCNKDFVLFYVMNDFEDDQLLSKCIQNLACKMITQKNVDPIPIILKLQNHPRLINHCTTSGGDPLVLVEELLIGLYLEIEDINDMNFPNGSPELFSIKETHLTTCKLCKSRNEEEINNMSMRIPFSNTIEESLRFYNNIKQTEVGNKYYKCNKCKMFTPVVQNNTKTLTKYPDNLVVAFERVKVRNNVVYSIFQEIDFNKGILIGGEKYEVYAAICSYMLRKGYHANAIAYKNGRWVLFNDNQLEVFPPDYVQNDIFNNYAWIIFYRKVNKN